MKALIVSLAAINTETFANEYIELLANSYASKSGMCGVVHDGQNLYVAQAPSGYLDVEHVELDVQTDADNNINYQHLELQIGKHLMQDSHVLLVGEHKVFDVLFKRPLWRLWCASFEDKDQLELAYDAYFGTSGGLDKRKSYNDLVAVVRTDIKNKLIQHALAV